VGIAAGKAYPHRRRSPPSTGGSGGPDTDTARRRQRAGGRSLPIAETLPARDGRGGNSDRSRAPRAGGNDDLPARNCRTSAPLMLHSLKRSSQLFNPARR
jgi:hypothetical protein